jgi:hypothetical protein
MAVAMVIWLVVQTWMAMNPMWRRELFWVSRPVLLEQKQQGMPLLG